MATAAAEDRHGGGGSGGAPPQPNGFSLLPTFVAELHPVITVIIANDLTISPYAASLSSPSSACRRLSPPLQRRCPAPTSSFRPFNTSSCPPSHLAMSISKNGAMRDDNIIHHSFHRDWEKYEASEREKERLRKQLEKMKRKHAMEMVTMKHCIAESRLPESALEPFYLNDSGAVEEDSKVTLPDDEQSWRSLEVIEVFDGMCHICTCRIDHCDYHSSLFYREGTVHLMIQLSREWSLASADR